MEYNLSYHNATLAKVKNEDGRRFYVFGKSLTGVLSYLCNHCDSEAIEKAEIIPITDRHYHLAKRLIFERDLERGNVYLLDESYMLIGERKIRRSNKPS
ncbi:MAG: hypothetical protein AABW89_04370 [Nanoarchaeota archaeon]